ncbi:response regulator, partial [Planctomycetota bacterium]
MTITNDILHIIMADDDQDDCLMVKEACEEAGVTIELEFVEDGEELVNLLSARSSSDIPTLILLDLNMPKKDGREALREIRRNVRLKYIPIVILTTSKNEDDVTQT